MAERSIPYTLVTPNGNVVFNDLNAFMTNQPCYLLTSVNGLDGGAVRATVERIPQRDGAVVFDAFQGEMTPILEGKIWAPTSALVRDRADYLKACCKSIMRADGTLSWFPSSSPDRKITVRLFDRVTVNPPTKGEWSSTFQIALVSPDDRAFSLSVASLDSSLLLPLTGGSFVFPFKFAFTFGDASQGGVALLANSGDTDTWPVIRIYGSLSSPVIRNNTTGQYVSLPGLSIGVGDYAEVDMRNETVKLNGSLSLIQYLDVANSKFWTLSPGTNSVALSAASPDGTNSKFTIIWRDAWA